MRTKRDWGVWLGALIAAPLIWLAGDSAAEASHCGSVQHEGESYTVCKVNAAEDLRLFLNAPDGRLYGSFERLRRTLESAGRQLVFAMNGGMYHNDRRPVGLYVEDGAEMARLITSDGPGNFGLLPNGVFCIGEDTLSVVESRSYEESPPSCRYASQSGPMLVIDGDLHPRFLKGSNSRYVRNGVGVSEDGRTAWFAISDRPVTFHQFGSFFRDALHTPNALYLDGSISKIYAPQIGRTDAGRPMGPILGVVAGG